MNIRVIILMVSLIISFSLSAYNQGDIIFQESQSAQSKYIKAATNSKWTHCGIICIQNNKEYVLEASDVVKLTPLKQWINKGKNKAFIVKKCPIKKFKINLKKYLNKKYDLKFDWSDDKMYCSELVYKIYLDNNRKICNLRKGNSYKISKELKRYAKKRGINLNSYMIAPSDLLK